MNILSKLWALIRKIIQKIVDFLKDVFGDLWPILLLIAAIYFAPTLAAWFSSMGLTSLGSAFTWVATNISPMVWDAVAWIGSSLASVGSSAWTAFKSLELGTQLAVVTGAAALLAPEETADLVTEVAETVVDVGTGIIEGVASAVPGWVWLAAGGALLFFLLSGRKKDTVTVELADQGGANAS